MHDRIYQIETVPIAVVSPNAEPDEATQALIDEGLCIEPIDEMFFYGNSFIGSIADGVSDTTTREEDLTDLLNELENEAGIIVDREKMSFTIPAGAKEKWFAAGFKKTKEQASILMDMALKDFINGEIGVAIHHLSAAYSRSFEKYVISSESND